MTQHGDGRSDLIAIIHEVRKRWRTKIALRGGALAAGCIAAALILSAFALQWLRFTPESILGFRLALALVVGLAVYALVVRPQWRRVTDEQVALYLEEHEPSLEAAIISAVEAEKSGVGEQSPALVAKLVQNAVEKVRAIEDGRRVERAPVKQYQGRSAACSRSPRSCSSSARPTCATRCRRCWSSRAASRLRAPIAST